MSGTKLELGRAPVWSWLPVEEIDAGAMEQITNLSNLPVAVSVAVMPDVHKGYGMPIGCALATKDAVVPYAVGVDIGCGMIATQLSFSDRDLSPHLLDVLNGIMARIPVGMPTKNDRNSGSHAERQNSEVLRAWVGAEPGPLTTLPFREGMRERADRQLGTLGSGNHFIELQADEDGRVWLMLHTGSRSLGKAICDKYHEYAVKMSDRWHTALPDKELAFIPLADDAGHDYLRDMKAAMDFAVESRERIEAAALDAVEAVGLPAVATGLRVDTHHNFASKERHLGQWAIVHRKGAVRTSVEARGTTGAGKLTPALVTIPGSMETGSYIARGIVDGNASVLSILTCSHGAGRWLGRNETRRQNVGVDIRSEMAAKGIVLVTPEGSDALDEAGRAYKDVESVMAYQSDLAEPVVKLRPLGVVKG